MLQVKGTLSNVPATGDYAGLKNKPQINGVELVGNKTTEELGLASKELVETLQKTIDGLIDGNEVAY